MFIDTHLHLSNEEGVSPDEFIAHAKEEGVSYLVLSCCDKKSIEEGLEFANRYDNVFLSVGFHPEIATGVTLEDLVWLEKVILTCSKVVAVGEIGLDYHWDKDHKKIQQELFQKQLEIAKRVKLPVVIHTRDAIQDTYDILKQYSLKGSIHCYSGSIEMAQKFIDLGYFLGIGGVVTFLNSKLYQVVESVGLSHLLLETDSPYLAPVPCRGSVNESKNIPLIAAKVSEILNVPLEQVASITTANAVRLFDLPIEL